MACRCGNKEKNLDKYLQPLEEILTQYESGVGQKVDREETIKEKFLIPVLQEAQDEYGYLPQEVLKRIASHLDLSLSQVYGVVTFYTQFHLEPRGKNIVRVCMGTACHVRGASEVLKEMEEELGIGNGETTDNLKFTLETVACIGACGLAPVIMINDETHGRLTPDKVSEILDDYR
ncbi:MAG: NADH-quinone oxidoreductase subunit NuoE [Bacillota bacterium]